MIKDKNSLQEENIHFTYNVEFSKFLCETNKEKIEKKFPISLNKESFDYYLYVHRDNNSNVNLHNLETLCELKYNILCNKNIIDLSDSNSLNVLEKFLDFQNEKNQNSPNINIIIENPVLNNEELTKWDSLNLTNSLNVFLNKKLIDYARKSNGRLDIYAKAHVFNRVILNLTKKIPNIKDNLKKTQIFNDFEVMEKDLVNTIKIGEGERLTNEKFVKFIEKFAQDIIERKNDTKSMKDLKKLLILYQNINDESSIKLLENLLVKLMGHPDKEIRNDAIKLLNILYDETEWQDKSPFPIKIISTGEKIFIELVLRKKDFEEKSLVLILNAPSVCKTEQYSRISWLTPQVYSNSEIDINFSNSHLLKYKTSELIDNPNLVLVKFESATKIEKGGYYDWNLVKFSNGRFSTIKYLEIPKLSDELKEAKGRFIAIDKTINNYTIHEVFADLTNAEIDKEKGKIIKRGNFQDIENKLEDFNKRFINCLYLMGALERDNQLCIDDETNEILEVINPDASPMAVTCRASVSKFLGGEKAFNSLVNKAKKYSMKIIIDSLTRISSSRPDRKYRKILLNSLDENGKVNICYGTDGQSVNYDDSAMLNYRKIESWDILVEDIISLARKYNVDGVHLDNCQTWPQILEIDHDEMLRLDSDGQNAYSSLEILDGEIVIKSEDCGYWSSDLIDQYPNPFLIKLTKSVWKYYPNFLFIGECWDSKKIQNRHIMLAKSGIIPRMYTLPRALASVFGRRIHRNGNIESCKPESVSVIRNLLEENTQFLPEGAVTIQGSSGQVWPYPALLYGRGNWSAIDLLFALPDIPMTFMDEIEGEAFRVKITNVYSSKELPRRETKMGIKSKSYYNLDKEINDHVNEFSSNNQRVKSTEGLLNEINKVPKIKSLSSLSDISIKEFKNIKNKQDSVVKEVGPEFGFDLTKIKFHYNHRRKMRNTHESLRNGKLSFLNVYDLNDTIHNNVFAFARSTQEETGIIIINFHPQTASFHLDMKPIIKLFETEINFNSICYIEDWISEEKGDFYFFKEIINENLIRTLNPYSSISFGFQIIPFTKDNFKRTMEKSISRLVSNIKSGKNTDNFQISIQLKYLLEKELGLEEYAKWFAYVYEVLKNYNLTILEYISNLNFITQNELLSNLFFEYNSQLRHLKGFEIGNQAEIILKSNLLGPIAFFTPEIGRWSTVGGLGVMVDELSQGLVKLGQDIVLIAPYYEKNRKGETGYIYKDAAKFSYIGNIEVHLDQKYIFGVHHAVVNKVKLYFLHNYDIFPSPYPEGTQIFTMKQISLFSKACLELLCFISVVPALILTNDWFTGLSAAYAKHNHFGETFKGTTFFHIVHNLEASYEGRLYPQPNEGSFEFINKLPSYCVLDPYWRTKVVNPSRCAILMSDQWGTVSPSYRKDLLETSPLAYLLCAHKKPFAYPNGIFKEQRLKNLTSAVGMSKEDAKFKIQMKYFGYKTGDLSVPLFSFVGRITQQKGVLLILEAAEGIINKYGGKVNILVGGMGNPKDPYCINCTNRINHLRFKYSYAFWANPLEFFTDGPLINVGSDFALMPSLFEPGGIVQHEFFIASTPVLAFKTGGLKDTVIEFDHNTNKGNGILFESHNIGDFMYAIERAMNLFNNKEKYEISRINAFNSAIDVMDVAINWCREFCRIRNKIFFNGTIFNEENQVNENLANKVAEILKKFVYKDYVFSKDQFIDDGEIPVTRRGQSQASVLLEGESRIPISFYFSDELITNKINSVQVCGSFDKWQVRHPLTFDPICNKWTVTLKIKKGSHYYKYIVDGDWKVSKGEKTIKDDSGFINNFISI